MKMANTRKLTADEQTALDALRHRPDSEIDLTDPDAPEIGDWSGAVRGALYKPIKKPIALRLDADLLAWFQSQGPGYQTRINAALREFMARHRR
jgi:uncharacterized protein (DUF4415 family)